MTQDPSAPATTDALLARYHAAQAALDAHEASGPSAPTRAIILDYAANIATNSIAAPAIKQSASGQIDTQKPAANDGQWKVRALATVAVFGLTSLLLLQWDRGTPEEKEVAFSTARPPVAAPAPFPAVAPATAPVTEPASAAAPAAAPPMPAAKAAADAPAAARPVDKSDATAKVVPPNARLVAPKVAQQAAPASGRALPFPSDAEAKRPSGIAPPPPTKDPAISAESATAGTTALPAPASTPTPLSAPAPAPTVPSMAAAAPPPPSAAAPAMRTAPAAKAESYGTSQSVRREDTPEGTARLKKSESAQDASSMAEANSAPAGRAASPNLALFAAIRSADAAAMQRALANGADKNAKSNGTPAITLCVQSGKLNLVQLLAAAGADVNAPDAQGTTPLAHARARGLDAIANALIALGAS